MEEKPKRKRRKPRLTAKQKRERTERIVEAGKEYNAKRKAEKEKQQLELKKDMPPKHKMFVDLYVWGDVGDTQGDHKACYDRVFDADITKCSELGRKLLAQPHIQDYLDKQIKEYETLMKVEKVKNVATLTKIRDEMASAEYVNRFGEINGVAACRSVSIRAAETVNKMLGFDKPKEINVNHQTGPGGLNFNLIVPEPKKPTEPTIDITPHEDVE